MLNYDYLLTIPRKKGEMMKLATYNIWNEHKGTGNRFAQIIHEIEHTDADVIGLQEVTPCFYQNYISQNTFYDYTIYHKYTNEEEGLAILSKYPITKSCFLQNKPEYRYSAALHVMIQMNSMRLSLMNLHLPWNSALQKEQQIISIDQYMHECSKEADASILLGDFNGSIESSIHRYLLGEQTLNGQEANPYWYELFSTFAAIHGLPLKPTLDFRGNPRWNGKNTTEIPYAADRIYVMYNRGKDILTSADLFGTEISEETHLSASDHYGVAAEIVFLK